MLLIIGSATLTDRLRSAPARRPRWLSGRTGQHSPHARANPAAPGDPARGI